MNWIIDKLNPYMWLVKIIGALIVALACWYAWHQFTGHYIDIGRQEVQAKWDADKAKSEKEATKQREENAQKAAVVAIAHQKELASHQAEINQIRSQSNAKIQSSIADSDDVWRDRLRNAVASDRARTVSELSSAAQGAAESGRNGDATAIGQAYDTLETACQITTSDYNALWNSWNKVCAVYGCK